MHANNNWNEWTLLTKEIRVSSDCLLLAISEFKWIICIYKGLRTPFQNQWSNVISYTLHFQNGICMSYMLSWAQTICKFNVAEGNNYNISLSLTKPAWSVHFFFLQHWDLKNLFCSYNTCTEFKKPEGQDTMIDISTTGRENIL